MRTTLLLLVLGSGVPAVGQTQPRPEEILVEPMAPLPEGDVPDEVRLPPPGPERELFLSRFLPLSITGVRLATRPVPRGVVPFWAGILLDTLDHLAVVDSLAGTGWNDNTVEGLRLLQNAINHTPLGYPGMIKELGDEHTCPNCGHVWKDGS